MTNSDQAEGGFEALKARLEHIAQAVSDESLPLDDALDLYEEAVTLGLKATDLLEDGIVIDEAAVDEQLENQADEEASSTDASSASSASDEGQGFKAR